MSIPCTLSTGGSCEGLWRQVATVCVFCDFPQTIYRSLVQEKKYLVDNRDWLSYDISNYETETHCIIWRIVKPKILSLYIACVCPDGSSAPSPEINRHRWWWCHTLTCARRWINENTWRAFSTPPPNAPPFPYSIALPQPPLRMLYALVSRLIFLMLSLWYLPREVPPPVAPSMEASESSPHVLGSERLLQSKTNNQIDCLSRTYLLRWLSICDVIYHNVRSVED